jgi:hypothetical protein
VTNTSPSFTLASRHRVAHEAMYQDAQGHVRIGLGHLLPTADHAVALPWWTGRDRHVATEDEVRRDWQKIADYRRPGRPARFPGLGQKVLTRVRLTDEGLQRTFASDFAQAFSRVRLTFGEAFDLFPGGAQIALIDLQMFGGLTSAVSIAADTRDWKKAAERLDLGHETFREKELARLFTEAAKPSNVLHVKVDRHWGPRAGE